MKYHSENELDIFEYHDAEFTLVRFENGELTIAAEHLNIHKDTPQNPSASDMEIEYAAITFKGFRTHSFEPGKPSETEPKDWIAGINGKWYSADNPRIVYEGKEAEEKTLQELADQMTVLTFGMKDSVYYFDACGIEPFFTIRFTFDSVTVEWDDYCGKAWYEDN